MRFLIPLFLSLFIYLSKSWSCSFLPENNMTISPSEKSDGLTEAQYHQVIDKVAETYSVILEKIGKKLTINRLWEDPRVNAGTTKKGNEVIINLYGGFARHPMLTEDGYALVICHELGHHLGGAPKKNLPDPSWPSTEGQADYYATLKCLRKVFRKDDNQMAIKEKEVPLLATEKCSLSFKQEWERALCVRTTLAGISVGNVMAYRRDVLPDINTPDQNIVDQTVDSHPLTQCRVDTYFQGSICEISSYKSVSSLDERIGTCHPSHGHEMGIRPACWFVPTFD